MNYYDSVDAIFGDQDLALPPLGDSEASKLYAMGVEQLKAGNGKAAAKAFESADALGHAGAPRRMGNVVLDDEPFARSFFKRAYERGDGNAASSLGQMAKRAGNRSEARALFEFADRSGDCEGAKQLGVLLREEGELDAAEAALLRADSRGGASASHSLGIFYEEALHDAAEAERAYRRAIDRGQPRSVFRLIEMLAARGETDEIETLRAKAHNLLDEHPTLFQDLRGPKATEYLRTVGLRQVAATSGGGCLLAVTVTVLLVLTLGLVV